MKQIIGFVYFVSNLLYEKKENWCNSSLATTSAIDGNKFMLRCLKMEGYLMLVNTRVVRGKQTPSKWINTLSEDYQLLLN